MHAPQLGMFDPATAQARQAATCESKVRYFTRDEAKHTAKLLSRQRRVKLKIYRCPCCTGWHLTKAENAKR